MQKGMSLFLSYTNMNKIKSLHHTREHPKISNFLQFESYSSNSVKVRAISDLRDLYGNNIQICKVCKVCKVLALHIFHAYMYVQFVWHTLR